MSGPAPLRLEAAAAAAARAEQHFAQRTVLFIGSESYDAPVITVLQGLQRLGFRILTVERPNINSWFCNEVVSRAAAARADVDFVLSNLHWGTRWSLYEELGLHTRLKVLIDGDDNQGERSWRDKWRRYEATYPLREPMPAAPAGASPEAGTGPGLLQRERWLEPLGAYAPDIVFTAQRPAGSPDAYLPFGIHHEYLGAGAAGAEALRSDRPLAFSWVSGPGQPRLLMERALRAAAIARVLPRPHHIGTARGTPIVSPAIAALVAGDENVHSWHRWAVGTEYGELLARSRVLVYAPPDVRHWDSKRPWEAYAAGCLVLLTRPTIDTSPYPLEEICPEAVCGSPAALVARLAWLARRPGPLERLRAQSTQRALRWFTPEPLARHFLATVAARRG